MKIVHISDWHGNRCCPDPGLPEADVYVVTGDMLYNFCTYQYDVSVFGPGEPGTIVQWNGNHRFLEGEDPGPRPQGVYVGRITDPLEEMRCQDLWIDQDLARGGFRRHLGSHDAQVIVVPGNHDFVQLSRWFGGSVFEVVKPTDTFEFGGFVWGGSRGINYIYGEWNDEISDMEWRARVAAIPHNVNMLVTHAPPRMILDRDPDHYGADALASYVNRRMIERDEDGRDPLRAHFFGHVHGSHGSTNIEGTLFSNAATTYLVYDI